MNHLPILACQKLMAMFLGETRKMFLRLNKLSIVCKSSAFCRKMCLSLKFSSSTLGGVVICDAFVTITLSHIMKIKKRLIFR